MTTCSENTKTETCLPGAQSCRGRCQDDPWFIVPASGYPLAFWSES